ncbi:spermidine synthase [Carbonactinospora thermoautotrophica]|uniref:Polyamine aminopropyltransferase n=1 Tax=Carbonactinospora thermoautotrophica TaxID=1469144 RepID=A0A132NEQ5_9ACTN|nr:polyamine aminopropyltransferase [Carbonactinospora thermoautotrophica]KWW98268.1 spermidine synthase [Carbonactinospora thermoautotrophica]KWX08623.1 spermidine synthase [Carbonactinospora thermoautotrophica]
MPLPVSRRLARFLVLLAVFVCAACGLVYELALVALGSYLIGDSVVQASIVLSVMVFAMGVGSLAAKGLQRRSAESFAAVEGLLALLGGLSVLALYASFAWLDVYQPALVVIAFVVGALIGAEIPLLMTLIQRIRRQDPGSAVADLFAADYVGALLGGLAFPFVLLPVFGQIRGALVTGAVNAIAGVAVVLWLFRGSLRRRVRWALSAGMALVLGVLAVAYALAGRFEVTARQALYEDPIVYAERSAYQDIVLTRSSLVRGGDLRLFLNGDLQFSSVDEYRYHEALVHPAMAGPHRSVLILGGGDGLALREVLRYPAVERVVEVELDPAVLRLARTYPDLVALNRRSLHDPRVRTVTADAFAWLRGNRERFDVVIVDMPDPDDVATAKLYSVEFYTMARRALNPGGRMVVQAGSPYFAPKPYWCVDASVRAAGLRTVQYAVDVPTFGNWGFVLAATQPPELRLPDDVPPLRYLDEAVLRAAAVFPKDRPRLALPPSTLIHPRILDYERESWRGY